MAQIQTTEVAIAADDGCALAGTLVVPAAGGPHPAALLLSGSGPLDRDSNMDGQVLGISWAIAEKLAAIGIASLRYDKRGVGRSEGDYLRSGFELETADALAAMRQLCDVTAVASSRVGVIGHSVGAIIASRIAAHDSRTAFAVLLAAAATPGRKVMEWQSDRISLTLPGPRWLLGRWFRGQQRRDRNRLLATDTDTLFVHRQETPAKWFREYMAYDPVPAYTAIGCPVLAITGGKDLQVNPADLATIASNVLGPCTTESPADLSHVLRCDPGKPKLAGYEDLIERPVDAELLSLITTWIEQTLDAAEGSG